MRVPLDADRAYTCVATGVDPTKLITRTFGWSQSASTTARPPFTRLTTPLGIPVFSINSIARRIVNGTRSEGFSTKVFPQAIAYGKNQNGIIAGKLKGVMAATTPGAGGSTVRPSPA